MSKHIFQAFLSDPDVPDAGMEAEDDEEPAKSWDLSPILKANHLHWK